MTDTHLATDPKTMKLTS